MLSYTCDNSTFKAFFTGNNLSERRQPWNLQLLVDSQHCFESSLLHCLTTLLLPVVPKLQVLGVAGHPAVGDSQNSSQSDR